MSKILNGTITVQKLASKVKQLHFMGIRYKKSCGSPCEPPSGCRPPPGLEGRCPPASASKCDKSPHPPFLPSPPACKLPSIPACGNIGCPINVVTMDDLPIACGWYRRREILTTSIYNRYLLIGLLMITISYYQYKRDEMMKRYNTNYQYMCDFDYDLDYKNMTETVEFSLEDVHNSSTV